MTDHEPLTPREREALKAERPRRWPARLAASPLWRIAGLGVVAVVAGVAVLAWAVLHSDDGDETAEFFALIEDAISRDGQMLHTFAESYRGSDLTTLEYWVDAESGAARLHSVPINPTNTGDGIPTEETWIVTADHQYIEDGPRIIKRYEATRCDGVSGWLSALLYCIGDFPVASATTDVGEWDGVPALVLSIEQDISAVAEDAAEPPPSPLPAYSFFYRLYIDSEDYLPLALVWEAIADDGTPAQFLFEVTFSHEFIERTSENLALLDVRAFGYGIESTAPLSTLAASMPVYWLGEEYEAKTPLQSIHVVSLKTDLTYGAAAALLYQTPSGSNAINVYIWDPQDWAASDVRTALSDRECVSVSEEELGGYTFTAYEMPPVNYPLPRAGESQQGDCWLKTVRGGGMTDSGLLLVWEADGAVVSITSTPTGFFRYGDSLRETVAVAFQPYEAD